MGGTLRGYRCVYGRRSQEGYGFQRVDSTHTDRHSTVYDSLEYFRLSLVCRLIMLLITLTRTWHYECADLQILYYSLYGGINKVNKK